MEKENGSQDVSKQAKRIEIDVAKYQAMLDDEDYTEAQKEQVLHALWSIVCNFVELGFEVHPVQQALGASPGVPDALDCREIKEKQYSKKEAATPEPRPGE